jgi:hypothetical protein
MSGQKDAARAGAHLRARGSTLGHGTWAARRETSPPIARPGSGLSADLDDGLAAGLNQPFAFGEVEGLGDGVRVPDAGSSFRGHLTPPRPED